MIIEQGLRQEYEKTRPDYLKKQDEDVQAKTQLEMFILRMGGTLQ
jgi:hypothetical protein